MPDISAATHDLIAQAVEAGAYLRVVDEHGVPLGRDPSSRDASVIRGALKTFPHGRIALDLNAIRVFGLRVGADDAEQIDGLFAEYGDSAAPALCDADGVVTFLFRGDPPSGERYITGNLPLPVETRAGSPDILAAIKFETIGAMLDWLRSLLAGRDLPAPPRAVAAAPARPAPTASSCATCRAFRPFAGTLVQGRCTVAPPSFGLDANGYVTADHPAWPEVRATDWCGQYVEGRAGGACSACRFFQSAHAGRTDVPGRCVCFAFRQPRNNVGTPVHGHALFPQVRPDDGCALFSSRQHISEVAA